MRNNNVNIAQSNSASLEVTIQVNDVGVDADFTAAKLEVAMGVFTAASSDSGSGNINAASLISADLPNDLKLGSDDKLVSQPADIEFLADYILASN